MAPFSERSLTEEVLVFSVLQLFRTLARHEDSAVAQTASSARRHVVPSHSFAPNSPAKFGPARNGSVLRRPPNHPCPATPGARTPLPGSGFFPVLLSSVLLCVPSDLCGVPLRAATIGAFPENTAEIGRNAERERAEACAPALGCGCPRSRGKLAARGRLVPTSFPARLPPGPHWQKKAPGIAPGARFVFRVGGVSAPPLTYPADSAS